MESSRFDVVDENYLRILEEKFKLNFDGIVSRVFSDARDAKSSSTKKELSVVLRTRFNLELGRFFDYELPID
jgi:hypothetical protein